MLGVENIRFEDSIRMQAADSQIAMYTLKENTECDHFLSSSNAHRMYDVDLEFNKWLNVSLKTTG